MTPTDRAAELLRYLLEQYCIREEWDMPGDTPIVVGFACMECNAEAARVHQIQHTADCKANHAAAIVAELQEQLADARLLLERTAVRIEDALPYTPDHRARGPLMQATDEVRDALRKAMGE